MFYKKNPLISAILAFVLPVAALLLVELIFALVQKKSFDPNWRWVILVGVCAVIGDILAGRSNKDKK